MASSRQIRGDNPAGLQPPANDYHRSYSAAGSFSRPSLDPYDAWEEPIPRNPVPSFEDHKGYERQGVLEHMQPLGTLPTAKVRARVRQHEGPRRAAQLRGGGRHFQEEILTPEPPGSFASTQPSPYYSNHSGGHQPLQAFDPPQEYDAEPPAMNGAVGGDTLTAPPMIIPESHETSPARPQYVTQQAPTPTTLFAPSPLKAQALRYKPIVDHAIRKANENGKYAVAIALQKIYEEALSNPACLDLMRSVLSNDSNDQTHTAFVAYIAAAKKEAKRSNPKLRHDARSSSSSHKKATGSNINVSSKSSPDPAQLMKSTRASSRTLRDTPSKTPGLRRANGSASKSEPAKKKMKRSTSTSTDSSLSSVNSDIERFAPSNIDPALTKPNSRPDGLQVADTHPSKSTLDLASTNGLHVDNDTPEGKLAVRKRQLQGRHLPTIRTSAVRSPVSSPRRRSTPPPAAVPQKASKQRRGMRELRSQVNDHVDSSDSPLSSQDEDIPPPPYAARGVTPQTSRLPKAAKKAARIKQSPLKKRGGVTAGLALPTESEPHQTVPGRAEDNVVESELCCACSGNGSLILCDGCPRGFHFTCCDPPLNPEIALEELPEQWYCHKCKDAPAPNDVRKSTGIWKDLHRQMQSKNPMAFRLPRGVRDYFEGIITGEEGEYEELPNFKISKARSGYEESPDNLKVKDRKDNTILCSRCGGSTSGKREIVPCDYCLLHWHLDCVDPPLANAPNRKPPNGKPRQAWMCPNHIDHDLQYMKATKVRGKATTRKPAASQLEEKTRIFKTRRPKNPTIINIGLRRGFRNHGLIEVIESSSDDESEIEREMSGAIYRIPERGIKLDFIDRIKQSNFEADFYARSSKQPVVLETPARQTSNVSSTDSHEQSCRQAFDRRSFRDRQAALNLQQLAQGDGQLDADRVRNLIQTLTAEAPPGVTSLLSSRGEEEIPFDANEGSHTAGVGEQERRDLEALIRLAQERLQMPAI